MKKHVYILIFLLILNVFLANIKTIPSYNVVQMWFVFLTLISISILGFWYVFLFWKTEKQTSNKIIKTLIFVFVFIINLIFTIPVASLFKPEYIKTITQNNNIYYIYNESCFPPDGSCECNDYGSLIYVKNKYLPIIHLLVETDFYVGDILYRNNTIIIKSSNNCPNNKNKTIQVNL